MSWEDGLKATVEWYKKYSHRYGNVDSALVAHPRMLNTKSEVDEEIQRALMKSKSDAQVNGE